MQGEGDPVQILGGALLDAAVTVDELGHVAGYNSHYRALLPRHLARKLPGSPCCQQLKLGICDEGGCLAKRCVREDRPLRYDEISAQIAEGGPSLTVIASAAPLQGGGAVILLRDVSDTAAMQRKYKDMLEAADRAQEKLKLQLTRKTQELLDANTELNRVQQELMDHKKGLFG